MGTKSSALTGARAKIYVDGDLVGVFTSCSWEINYGMQPIYVLGRLNAADSVYTDMDVVTVTCNGYRAVGHGPHQKPRFPKLQDLLQHESIVLFLQDRLNKDEKGNVLTVVDCRPTRASSDAAARGLSGLSVTYVGLAAYDESGVQEDQDGTKFPTGN